MVGPRFLLGDMVSSHSHVQPMTLMGNMGKKLGAVYVRDSASHWLTWVISEAPVLSG